MVVDDEPGNAALQQLRFYVDKGGGFGSALAADTIEIDRCLSAG